MRNKKNIIYLTVITIIIILCGCGNANYLNNNDFLITDNITSKNITLGDSSEDFIRAYSDIENDINVRYANGDNHLSQKNINDIDFSQTCTVNISGIDVDGTCIPVKSFIKKEKIEDGLDNWIAQNNEYINKHNVVYKVLAFSFENNIIVDIRYIEKNYNESN